MADVFPGSVQVADKALVALKAALGSNLHSCAIYGSTVRGNAVSGVSDINLLIVLKDSDPNAHEAIADVLGEFPQVDPFILCLAGLDRTVSAFAAKFASIQRNYRTLYGEDVLARIQIDAGLQRFLSEQSLRNLRLRIVYAFVTRRQNKVYDRYLRRSVSAVFIHCSEVLRLSGVEVPKEFESRVPVLEQHFGINGQTLRDLLALKYSAGRLSDPEAKAWHARVVPVLDLVLNWIDEHWPAPRCL